MERQIGIIILWVTCVKILINKKYLIIPMIAVGKKGKLASKSKVDVWM